MTRSHKTPDPAPIETCTLQFLSIPTFLLVSMGNANINKCRCRRLWPQSRMRGGLAGDKPGSCHGRMRTARQYDNINIHIFTAHVTQTFLIITTCAWRPRAQIYPTPTTFLLSPLPMGPQVTILAVLTTLFLFSGSAVSQISYALCTTSTYDWVWTTNAPCPNQIRQLTGLIQAYNSLNQNPCEVAAYMEGTCNQGGECFPLGCANVAVSSFDSVYHRSAIAGKLVRRPERC